MQGKKNYTEKLFANFQLSERVPVNNFYRLLKEVLDLDFLYPATKPLYGDTGNPSIDPKVFFKLLLVGYLENITSDRKLMDHCSMRLDILYFLGYDIDEPLSWHSTVSRTRKLYPEPLFEELFNRVFAMCVGGGMVSGDTQCVDSALSKANASKDSLVEIKRPVISIQEYFQKSKEDNDATEPNGSQEEKKNIKKKINSSKRSATDPDARLATRPGKGTQLGYLSSVAVDTQQHVITHIQADFADKRDSECLPAMMEKTQQRLQEFDLQMRHLIADTNYSSGENYELLEQSNITAWIPVHGAFQPTREGFQYDELNDCYTCANNKQITLRRTFTDKRGYRYKKYFSSAKDCKMCPLKLQCIGEKKQHKEISRTFYQPLYEKAYHQQSSAEGKKMRRLRSSRVEPVIGTLMNYLGLRKLRVRGIIAVNKVMLLAATVYNLKKYINHIRRETEDALQSIKNTVLESLISIRIHLEIFKRSFEATAHHHSTFNRESRFFLQTRLCNSHVCLCPLSLSVCSFG
jgi:transposase